MEKTKKRIDWIDIAKFFGILFIFVGHFPEASGLHQDFFVGFHVHLFFFLSGCIFYLKREDKLTFKELFIKKFKSLILPYFFLCFFFVFIYGISDIPNFNSFIDYIKEIFVCIRGQLHSGALWFLPCLFIVTLEYKILKRIIKNKYIILIISFVLFALSVSLPYDIVFQPQLPLGLDVSLYYIIFFTLGDILFPKINNALENINSPKDKIFLICCGISTTLYALLFFFEIFKIPYLAYFLPIINALILIFWIILISKFLENFKFLQRLGSDSLFLCGNETSTKYMVSHILSLLGLSLNLQNAFQSYIYCFLLIILIEYVIIPVQKKIYNRLINFLSFKN